MAAKARELSVKEEGASFFAVWRPQELRSHLEPKRRSVSMKRWLLSLIVVPFLFAVPADAQYTVGYGWEDGVNTILGSFGNVCCDVNQNVTVHTGTQALEFQESPIGGTPQAYVARIANLQDGDVVTASFWTYDITPGGSPSVRIWGHSEEWCQSGTYAGSQGGNAAYPAGTGWEQMSHTWVFAANIGTYPVGSTLVVEARMYAGSGGAIGWVDDIEVTVPDHAVVFFPGDTCSPTSNEDSSWGDVKSLFR